VAAATAASSAAAFSFVGFRGAGLWVAACCETDRFGRAARAVVSGFCRSGPAAGSAFWIGFCASGFGGTVFCFGAAVVSGSFEGAAAAGPGAPVAGLGGDVAGIIIGVAGLSGSAGGGGGIGAVATGSSAAPDGAVPTTIAARTAGKKIRATWFIGDPSRAE